MIDFISLWARGIVIAVIISTIIEMLIPNGNSKKYIKVVIGIYILFNIISPIINKISFGKIDIGEMIDYRKEIENYNNISKTMTNYNQNIKELYINNLKKDIKNKIEEKGYEVQYINLKIENNEEYTIKNIEISINKKEEINNDVDINVENEKIELVNIEKVKEVNIEISKKEEQIKESKISEKDKKEIKQFLSNTYKLKEENIKIL